MGKLIENRYIISLVFAFAALIRFYNLDGKELWVDEIIQVMHSSPNNFWVLLEEVTKDRGGVPLDYLVQHIFLSFFGISEFAARIHAAIFGSLTVIVIYFLAKKMFDSKTAFITAVLYAVYPLHHHYSQEGRPYALFVFITCCNFLVFWNLLEKRRKSDWFLWFLITAISFYTNYFTVFVVFAQISFLIFLLLQKEVTEIQKINWLFIFKAVGVATAAFVCLIPWIIFGLDTIYGYEPSPEKFNLKLFLRLIQEFGDRSYPLSILLIILIGLGIKYLFSAKINNKLAILILWGLLPLSLIFLLLWLRDYFFAIRQILFMTPALYILAATGILYAPNIFKNFRLKEYLPVFLTGLVFLISSVVIILHFEDKRPAIKEAAIFLQQQISAKDVVIAPQIDYTLTFFSPGLETNIINSEILGNENEFKKSDQTVWFVISIYTAENDKRTIENLLGKTTDSEIQRFDFKGIQVIKIQRRNL